jgi:hypothetical protein
LLCDVGVRSPAAFAVTVPVQRLEQSRAATGSVATITKILPTNSATAQPIAPRHPGRIGPCFSGNIRSQMSKPPGYTKLAIEERKRKPRSRRAERRIAKRSTTIPARVTPDMVTLVQAPTNTNSTFPQPSHVQMIRPRSSLE